MNVFKIFKNRIIKNSISILLIILLLFDIFIPLKVNAYFSPIEDKKNYSQNFYFEEKFSFYFISKYYSGMIETEIDLPRFTPIGLPEYDPQFLIGIVNVDYDTDAISKEIGKDVFLGMMQYEIINEIKNKHKGRIWNYNGKNVYNYSIGNKNIIVNLDSMRVDKYAKGGIAVILEVVNLPMMNETPIHNVFELKSKCINDNSENEGIIRINEKDYSLPYPIELPKNKIYEIRYDPIEGYEFDHWEIYGGKLSKPQNSSYNILLVQNDYGEIIAYYRKIEVTVTTTTSTSSTTSISSTYTKTTETKTSTKSTQFTTSIKTSSSISTTTKTTTTLTSSSSTKEETESIGIIEIIIKSIKNFVEIISSIIKEIINVIIKIINIIINVIIEFVKIIIEYIKKFIEVIVNVFNSIINYLFKKEEKITTTQSISSIRTSYSITQATISKSLISIITSYTTSKSIITNVIKITLTTKIKSSGLKTFTTTIESTIYNTITSYKTITLEKTSTLFETSYSTIKSTLTKEYTISSSIGTSQYSTTTIKEPQPKAKTIYIKTTAKSKKLTSSSTTTKSTTPFTISSIKTSSTSKKIITQYVITTTKYYYKSSTLKTITTFSTKPEYYTTTYTIYATYGKTYRTALDTVTTTRKIATSKKSSSNLGGGGGGPGRALRDSILSHPNVYKEFLNRVKKIENKKELPLLYLVYKVTPLRVEQYPNYEILKTYSIHPKIRNYDNIDRECKLSIGENGLFLIRILLGSENDISNSIAFNMKEIVFSARANKEERAEIKIFFLPEERYLSYLPESYSASLCLSLYVNYNGEWKEVDTEPEIPRRGVKLSGFGELLISSAILSANILTPIGMVISAPAFPFLPLFFLGIKVQQWAEYLSWKDAIVTFEEAKSAAEATIHDMDDLISEKPSIENYIKGSLLTLVDIVDPINVLSGIIIGDLNVTLIGQMRFLLQKVSDPKASLRDKASAIGDLAGTIFLTILAIKQFNKDLKNISKKLRNAFDKDYENIIKRILKDKDLAVDTIGLFNSALMKIGESASEELARLLNVIKLLINEGIDKEVIKSSIKDVIKKIENGEVKNIKELVNIRDEIILDKLKAAKLKIYGEDPDYGTYLSIDTFKKIGGEIPSNEEAWAFFEGFTLDGKKIKFIRSIGKGQTGERIKFGAKTIHDRIETDELYVKLIKMVYDSKDFYEMFNEHIGKTKIGETIIEMISHNKIKIDTKGSAKIIELEDVELRWDEARGVLGIAGKFKTITGEEMIEICTDGGIEEGAHMKILCKDKGRMHGRKIHKIEWDEEERVLKIVYGYERNMILRRITFEGETSIVKIEFSIDEKEIRAYGFKPESKYKLIDNGRVEEWFSAGRNTHLKGEIAELWGKDLAEFLKIVDEVKETAKGVSNERIADLHGIKDNKPYPGEVKSFDGTGKSLQKIKSMFDNSFGEAREQLHEDFENKEKPYTNSKWGFVIIFGLCKDKENGDVKIDVLIAIVHVTKRQINEKTGEIKVTLGDPEIIFKPIWWQED